MNSPRRTLSLMGRGISSYLFNRPLSISFEITYSCNAHCKHCHLGGIIRDEEQAPPEKFGELCRQFRPLVAQISGGEPLLRKDVADVARAMRVPGRAPFIVLTTNARLLTTEKFYQLREAGVDQFSVSLDYPDGRHDEFRKIRGLFKHIDGLMHQLDRDKKAITLSCVVQKDNFRELPKIAELSQEWGVRVNFSTYTHLRTSNKDYLLDDNDLIEFRGIVRKLLQYRKKNKNFFASEYTFRRMIRFFEQGGIDHCRAGERFFIVNPNGAISPCGLILKYYKSLEQMQSDFVAGNSCTECNTSIRSNCEKPLRYHFLDNIRPA